MLDSGFDPTILLSLGIILFSLCFHEMAHAITAYWGGDDTARLLGRITMNPLSHIDPIGTILVPVLASFTGVPLIGWAKPVPVNPSRLKREYWMPLIAFAGPASNFLLALLSALIMRVILMLTGGEGIHQVVFVLGYYFIVINCGLALFNLLPVPPLDGSRLLFHWVINGRPQLYPMWEKLERYSIFVLYAIILLPPLRQGLYTFFRLVSGQFLNLSGLPH